MHLPKTEANSTGASCLGSRRHVNGVLVRGTHRRCQWKAIFSKLGQNTTSANTSSFEGHQLPFLLSVSLICRQETNWADTFPLANGGRRTPSSDTSFQSKGIIG